MEPDRPAEVAGPRRAAPALAAVGGLALLAAACWPMQVQSFPAWAGGCLVLGLAAWIWLGRDSPPEADPAGPIEAAGGRPRLAWLLLALAAAAACWVGTRGGVFRPAGALGWLGAVAFWIAAWRPAKAATPPTPARRSGGRSLRLWALALLAILAVGAFFLFHRLEATPNNPMSDHAETLLDLEDLRRGERPIFFIRNTGREPLKFYWLQLLVVGLGLPASFLTLKIATASIGILAIPAVYLAGRELGGDRLGLPAALLVAIGKWPFSMARLGLRVTHAVFPTALVLWALLRYLRRGDRASVLWAGVAIGIGLYGYTPFRVVPLLVPIALAIAAFDPRRRGRRRKLLRDGLLIAATALVVFLPLFHFMAERPVDFWYRVTTRAGEEEHPIDSNPIGIFARNVANLGLAFHWRGAWTTVMSVEEDPFLDPITGGLLLGGLVVSVAAIARGSGRWAFVLASLFILTLPSTLNLAFPRENPSINRAAAAIPAVFLLAALPVAEVWRKSRRAPPWTRALAAAALAAGLAVAAWSNYRRYFVDFDRQFRDMSHPVAQIAATIRDYARQGVPLSNVYLLGIGHWVDPRSLGFELGDPQWAKTHEIWPGEPPPSLSERPLLFVYRPDDVERCSELARLYDGEERRILQPHPDRDYMVWLVR